MIFFFFKQKTAYEMRISDWSSDVCSSDLASGAIRGHRPATSNRASATSTAGLPTSSNITPVTTAALPTRSTLSGKPGPDRTGANRETHYEFRWYHFRPRHHRPVVRQLDVHHLDPRQDLLPRHA